MNDRRRLDPVFRGWAPSFSGALSDQLWGW